ncbi:MAG: hypothetical protein D6722_13695 [Bacteroidetes bacterium]|nr:MAG: hypothetical protein D6722_13695 [Bacteroidota bacterium]
MKKLPLSLLLVLQVYFLSAHPSTNRDAPPTLDAQHQQGLSAITRDLADLHSRLQTSSYADIQNHPRITISGDWNQVCLVNLMTLIQNQGLNRKLFNDGALTTVDMMLDLVDPFTAPFSTLKRFLTSEAVEELIMQALQANDPEAALRQALAEKAQQNGTSLPEGAEGERLQRQLTQLMEMYALAQENARLPKDAKWYGWDFDPGRSTLDDFVPDFISPPDRVIPSQAMVRFGTVDPADSPVQDNSNGRGLTLQRVVMKGVAEAPYPASARCVGQIQYYSITIHNYGHVENGRFVSDYIEYEIDLHCCNEEDEDVAYDGTEPISFFPGEDYPVIAGGILGYGRVSGDNQLCLGAAAQYYPGLPLGPCGAQVGVGLQTMYAYTGFSQPDYRFTNQALTVAPQVLVQAPVIPNLHLISGLSVPFTLGGQRTVSAGQTQRQSQRSFGLSLLAGLSVELPQWQLQLQTDLLGWQRLTTFSPDTPDERNTRSEVGLRLNKGNPVTVTVGKRLGSL